MRRPTTLLAGAVLCVLALVGPVVDRAWAHEHMYIASTVRHGGALVLDYDFATRAFPLAELSNQPGTWISVDPSFNSLVTDDPARSLYRLKNGTKLTMEIVSIDPAVTVLLANKTLSAPRQKATVGKMPYLHIHPQWTLTLPPGTYGDGHLSFRVRAPGYKPSPVYAATMSAIAPPTTTTLTTTTTTGDGTTSTTTLPLCTAVSCDDHDPCTDDVCTDATTCTHTDAVAADAVLCRLRALQSVLDEEQPATPKARKVLGRLYTAVTKARAATQTARSGGTARQFKQVGKRISRLTTIIDAADRTSAIDPTRVATLQSLATTAYDALTLWQSGQ